MANNDSVTLSPEAVELASKLTKLQRQTVLGVVSGKSQRQSYYDAGGKAKTDDSADSTVSGLLSLPKVRTFHNAVLASITKSAVMTREEALERLSNIARTSVKDVAVFRKAQVGEDGDGMPVYQSVWEMKDSDSIEDEQAAAITEISAGRDGIKFKLTGQAAAIKQLTEMEGWAAPTKQNIDHTSSDGSMSPMSLNDFYNEQTDPQSGSS